MSDALAGVSPQPLTLAEQRMMSPWGRMIRAYARDRLGMFGLILFLLICLAAVMAPQISRNDPTAIDIPNQLAAPSSSLILGGDELGRSVFTRVIFGARVSLAVGLLSVFIAAVIGIPLGLFAGYWGGILDTIIMRSLDSLLAFPSILLAISLTAILGPNLITVSITIGIVSIPQFARLTRASVLTVKENEYVEATQAVGATDLYIMFRSILPNCIAPLIVQITVVFAMAVLIESALSFLGYGIQPPTPSWGGMLRAAKNYLSQAWWYATSVGLMISFTILSLQLIGDSLQIAIDQ
jgi:peptide/nickel transport system permease protein